MINLDRFLSKEYTYKFYITAYLIQNFEGVLGLMDKEIRDELAPKLDVGTRKHFVIAYLDAHLKKYGTEFIINPNK